MLIQGAVVGLRHAAAAHPDDTAETVLGVRTADAFLTACVAALRLTAAFSPQDYEESIRPSMMSQGEDGMTGFSGLWSADHRVLVDALRTWGSLAALHTAPPVREAHASLRETLAEVYAAHTGMCRRFTGEGASLLRQRGSCVATLERLAGARQRLLAAEKTGRDSGC
ncbi:hypothetical protein M878_20330 [Streptomyces roseochromogenus subsp. oscitans DS 12.976]|uniref:Uncharacterized protein n=1 Tax=Streptomyces roseochromogenus subsp. oscitans DS 12.976 TaxID=1352936 RepID=V6KC13_STRRC|nr:hypothetical protein M878_20330 [Streptomyces roseochromogenus subsp. oscitans DS 12.976]